MSPKLALAFVVLGLMAVPLPSASAGTYTQHLCHLPDGAVAPVDGFTPVTTGPAQTTGSCATDGGLFVALPATSSVDTQAAWRYDAPAGTSIEHFRVSRGAEVPSGSNMAYRLPGTLDECSQSMPCPFWSEFGAAGSGIKTLNFWFECPTTGCSSPGPGRFGIRSLVVDLRDDEAPVFRAPPSGGLVDGVPVSGAQTVSFQAADLGGGLKFARLAIDGVEREAKEIGTCAPPFVDRVPCPSTADGAFAFDVGQLAPGDHWVTVKLVDIAGNEAIHGPVALRVQSAETTAAGTPGAVANAANGLNASRGARISAIGISKRKVRWQGGRKLPIAGRVVTPTREPVAGAVVDIYEKASTPGAKERRIGAAETDAAGRFRFLVPEGANRRITVRYRAFAGDAADAASWSFTVLVHAPVRLLPSRSHLKNGETLTLTAYLLGGRAPKRSADVAFQVRIGRLWRTFAKRTLDEASRARVQHRFRVTFHRMTYRFRIVTLKRKGFPYADGHSPVVAVRVN